MNEKSIRLGNYIKKERELLGLSKRRMAALVGISDTELRRIEDGERECPNLLALINMCYIFEKDIKELLMDMGYYKREEEQLFYLILKTDKVNVFKIHAVNEESAIVAIWDFILQNNIIEKSELKPSMPMYVTPDETKFKKVLSQFENMTLEELEEMYNKMENLIIDEEPDFECEFDDEESDCKCFECEHFCHFCVECTYDE